MAAFPRKTHIDKTLYPSQTPSPSDLTGLQFSQVTLFNGGQTRFEGHGVRRELRRATFLSLYSLEEISFQNESEDLQSFVFECSSPDSEQKASFVASGGDVQS